MSRPENALNQGYVPTPPEVISQLANSNVVQRYTDYRPSADSIFRLFDPCCGDGAALQQLAKELLPGETPFTWGVEINQTRAREARKTLHNVVYGDALNCDIVPGSFDVMWLNPPYDHMPEGGRMERQFLLHTMEALRHDGILFYIVPEYVAEQDWKILCRNFNNLVAYRFPEPHYRDSHQVIVMGHRNAAMQDRDSSWHPRWHERIKDMPELSSYSDCYLRLRDDDWKPPARSLVRTFNINSSLADHLDKLEQTALTSGIIDAPAVKDALDPDYDRQIAQPLAPMRQGHVIMAMANGQLNNAPLIDPTGVNPPVVVSGTSYKVEEPESASENKRVTKDHIYARLKVMRLDTGEIEEIDEQDGSALAEFMSNNWNAIAEHCRQQFYPKINPTAPQWQRIRDYYRSLERPPISFQYQTGVTLAAALTKQRYTYLVGEQGTGKTYLAVTAALAAGLTQILVTAPTHALETWMDELKQTVPHARVRIVKGLGNPNPPLTLYETETRECEMPLARIGLMEGRPESPVICLMSKETARNGHPWGYSIIDVGPEHPLYRDSTHKLRNFRGLRTMTHGEICPFCWHVLLPPISERSKVRRHHQLACRTCDERLAYPDVSKMRRIPAADYIVKKMKHWPDLYICDEVHQMKAGDSAQGEECGRIAQAVDKTLAMTGTLIGGKASELFYLLQRFGSAIHADFKFNQEKDFVTKYGRYRYTYSPKEQGRGNRTGTYSRNRQRETVSKAEIVGFHPGVLKYVLPYAVFIKREDMLPEKTERFTCTRCEKDTEYGWDELCFHCRMNPKFETKLISLSDIDNSYVGIWTGQPLADFDDTVWHSQQSGYHALNAVHEELNRLALRKNSMSGFPEARQNLMTFPETAWKGTEAHAPSVVDPSKPLVAKFGDFKEDVLYPKEQAVLEMLDTHVKQRGKKVLIYVTHSKKRSVIERLAGVIEKERALKVKVLPDGNVRGRAKWLRDTAETCDVVIASAKSMETGLNCQQFPIIIWYEIHESMYTTDQASARSARINQTDEVEVYFMAYRGTLQHDQLSLIARKSDTARRMYGDLGRNGLSALNPEDTDLTRAMEQRLSAAMDDDIWQDFLLDEADMNQRMQGSGAIESDLIIDFDMAFDTSMEEAEPEEVMVSDELDTALAEDVDEVLPDPEPESEPEEETRLILIPEGKQGVQLAMMI